MKNYGGQHTADSGNNMNEELADVFYLLLKSQSLCVHCGLWDAQSAPQPEGCGLWTHFDIIK